jgi:transcription termination factor NusB
MSTAARRIADLEVIARGRQPDGPPTWTFFAQERFQARANYGNQSPATVLEDIEDVERIIRAYEAIRTEHRLDVIELAIVIATCGDPDHAPTPSGIASSIVAAYFHWDMERFGEDRAWRHQWSRGEFEGQIAGRLARMDAA